MAPDPGGMAQFVEEGPVEVLNRDLRAVAVPPRDNDSLLAKTARRLIGRLERGVCQLVACRVGRAKR